MTQEIDELETPPEYIYLDEVQEELSENGFQIIEPEYEEGESDD